MNRRGRKRRHVMAALRAYGPQNGLALMRETGYGPGTIHPVLAALEHEGLVTHEQDPATGRVTYAAAP